jgi:hypothetical protein
MKKAAKIIAVQPGWVSLIRAGWTGRRCKEHRMGEDQARRVEED